MAADAQNVSCSDEDSPGQSRTVVYTAQYRERLVLGDGRLVHVRLLRPADRKRLRRFFEHLSERSRTARFLKPRREISDEELAALSRPSSPANLSIGVFTRRRYFVFDYDLLGSAHFERLEHSDDTAEIVICTMDSVQGLGLGKILMRRLGDAALERGIRRFTLSMLTRNAAARSLFASAGFEARFERLGELTEGEIHLTRPESHPETDTTTRRRRRFLRWSRARQRRG